MATINEMRQVATQIQNETQVGGNTADRVGGLFNDVVDKLEPIDGIAPLDANPTSGSTKGTTSGGIYATTPTNAETNTETDLDIDDPSGNVLVRFSDGHVKTKNFDSKNMNISVSSQNDSDLDIADEQGNVLVRFGDGGVETKNFNSKVFDDAPPAGYDNFVYEVDASVTPDSSVTTASTIDSKSIMQDRGIIAFPSNYSSKGKPVRLVIANQGSSGRVQSSSTAPTLCVPDVPTLLGEGYAVLQINGTPNHLDGIANYGAAGTPDYLRCIVKAYGYVISKYNIRRDGVLLCGYSQGTLKCWQIAANKVLPVIACAMFGPCLDLWKTMYAYCNATHKAYMFDRFGFVEKEANKYVLDIFGDIYASGDNVTVPSTYAAAKAVPNKYELAYILNNYEHWLGYDPICWATNENIIGEQFRIVTSMTTNDAQEDAIYANVAIDVPCPMMLFVGTSDDTTPPKLTRWYSGMADNGGEYCHVRFFTGGDHHYTYSYPSVNITTKYGGVVASNVPSLEGLLFLERYDF